MPDQACPNRRPAATAAKTLAGTQRPEPSVERFVCEMETDAWSPVKTRRGQRFFRSAVFFSHNHRCCITGIAVPELLRASHIVAWKDDIPNRLNPRNGLCLAATQDAAFDRHLITLDEDLRLVLSKRLRDHCTHETLRENFLRFEGNKIASSERFAQDRTFHNRQREQFGARPSRVKA